MLRNIVPGLRVLSLVVLAVVDSSSYDLSNAQQYVNEFMKIFRHMTAFDPDGRPVFQQTKMRFYKGSLGRMLSKLSAVYMGFGPLPSM